MSRRRTKQQRLTERNRRILYAADHMIGAIAYPDDAHAGDSRDLAWEIFEELAEAVRKETP